MKSTSLTVPTWATAHKGQAKKSLHTVIIFTTSVKFFIFVATIATVICWCGAITEDYAIMCRGAILFLTGFTPWAWRETIRGMHHPERFK